MVELSACARVEPQADVVGMGPVLVERGGQVVVQCASGVRSAAGRTNSNSSARCTIVPLVVATPGGSGSFSMLENRNCIGHEVNDDTRDGDK